jgi:acyl-CoA synthetase (AMP-forming)/AMP-acid ligase II
MNVPLYHLHGRPVVLMPRFRPAVFVAAARRHRVTTTTLAPTMLSALLDHLDATDSALPALRRVGYGAAPMPAALLDRAAKRLDVQLTESYGMTELSGAVSFDGIPGPLAVVRVVDDELRPLPAGAPGEIVVCGDQVAAGYWDEPALSSATFRDGWLRTGDLGQFDDAGALHVVGRLKDVIITGGENVMAGEVEAALEQHPLVQSAAVIGVPDDYWGEAVCAFVVPAPGQVLTAADISAHAAGCLGSFKRPRIVHFVGDLPLGASGKVAKGELRRRAAELDPSTKPRS